MEIEIDAAVERLTATIAEGDREASQRASIELLVTVAKGIIAPLERIAAAAERHNEAVAVLAARRFNIDHL